MNGADEDSGEKSHDPTDRKLEEARRKGQVPRSPDVTGAAATGGFLLAAIGFGRDSMDRIGTALAQMLDRADIGRIDAAGGVTAGLLPTLAVGLAPWICLPALAALCALLAQRALTVTGENLMPQLSRLSPLSAAKHKFGAAGLFEFAKATTKMILIAAVLAWFLKQESGAILGLMQLGSGQVTSELGRILTGFLSATLGVSVVIATADWMWQRFHHLRSNRMSFKDLRDETKEAEGDPWLKAERRQRGIGIATNRMLADVPGADVVIVNPTHYAVALTWSRAAGSAPVCVAKGVDEVAARIRAAAAEAGVPIHRDPPTARSLYATVDIGQPIRRDEYRAVAAAIRFAERIRAEARTRRR